MNYSQHIDFQPRYSQEPTSPHGSHRSIEGNPPAEDENSLRSQHANSHDDDSPLETDDVDVTVTARGTDVNVRVAGATFLNFLRNFGPGLDNRGDTREELSPPYYILKIEAMIRQTEPCSLDIDTMHLFYHNQDSQQLYYQLLNYPMELIPLMDLVVQREARRIARIDEDDHFAAHIPLIQVRPYNLREVSNLRCLDPIAMDTLVCLKGMIVRTSPIIPDLKVAHFSCVICGSEYQASIERGRIEEPQRCNSCNTKNTFQLIHNRSLFADKQLVRLQETPDQVPPGQTPASVVTFCYDNLVDTCQPGDKVEVTGVMRAQPVRVNPKISKVKSIYKTYVDVIHYRSVNGMQRDQKGESATTKLTMDRIQELKRLAAKPDIYEMLTKSLAPSIWELDDVKKGVLCMLFGGTQRLVREINHFGSTISSHGEQEYVHDRTLALGDDRTSHKRGDINILLCGDPGTSKSQLLSYVHKLSPRGVYTSGKGSSAVGLTACVVRDPETRDLVLESGALVLSDRGICCIDEFDKMTDSTRSILHEAMEQQTVSIAKAGIIASLNARTSILASANPLESRYNPNLSVVDNIKLPPTLLSRFDLIYLILDSPNADQDRKLADHLVGLYHDTPVVVEPPMDTDLLRDYIDYAREHVHPILSDEATQQLLESYLELRNPSGGNVSNHGSRTISATPRQLESLVRTSEALAKMRYSSVVECADAREALRLLKVATQAAATDPRTGRIDMDMINTGRSTMDRENGENLYQGLKYFLAERRGERITLREVTKQMGEISNQTIPQDELVQAIRRLESDGMIQFHERTQNLFVRSGILS